MHADATVFLFARGANLLHPCNSMTVVAQAETGGH